ncbi:MAG: aminopeptidase P family protein [Bacteroidota bacterium]
MFPASTYSDRRTQLAAQFDSGLILLLGNKDAPMNYADNVYPFRQDSSFLYYFGLDTPGLAALIDMDSGTTTVFGTDVTMDMVVWTGPQPSLQEMCSWCGITHVQPITALGQVLQEASSKGRTIRYLPPYRADNLLRLHHGLELPVSEIQKSVSVDLIKAIVDQRSVKSPDEIVELEQAINVTHQMHMTAMELAQAGMLESDLMAAVYEVPLTLGRHPSFPIILTVHGETLHNHHYHHTLEEGQLLLVDAGGESDMHYAGDMTRTFPVGRQFTAKQKEIYQIVLDANVQTAEVLKPGITFKEVHLLAAKIIATGLTDLGLMKGNVEEAVEAGAHALFFPHGLGHMLGLDTHDMEDLGEDYVGYTDTLKRSPQFGLKSLRLGRTLKPGFVLTIEPGIYFIPALIDKWREEGKHTGFINYDALESYKDFGGIRIEDDHLITVENSRLLGEPVPKTIEEVEEVRGG